MSNLPRFQAHERLMSRMAEAQGADLESAMQFGEITPEEYADAVLACTGCSDVDGCKRHLQEDRTGIPGFCRNSAMIGRLSAKTITAD